MAFWLVKSEPGTYSWENLLQEKSAVWDGIRNAEARLNLKKMKIGDLVLFYHTGSEKSIVGYAQVIEEAFPEKKDPAWFAVKLKPIKKLASAITLETAKGDPLLKNMSLVRFGRLSVQPVTKTEFDYILKCSGTKP
ncbi:MAG: EVE domain-containing protein [Bacteroidetes bacterium]|nr:EVE domain-containing protein [Bacteroidota bacterium]